MLRNEDKAKQNLCVIEFVLVRFGCTSCEFGGVMARIWRDSLAKISMVNPNEPDIPPKLTKTKDRLGRKNWAKYIAIPGRARQNICNPCQL